MMTNDFCRITLLRFGKTLPQLFSCAVQRILHGFFTDPELRSNLRRGQPRNEQHPDLALGGGEDGFHFAAEIRVTFRFHNKMSGVAFLACGQGVGIKTVQRDGVMNFPIGAQGACESVCNADLRVQTESDIVLLGIGQPPRKMRRLRRIADPIREPPRRHIGQPTGQSTGSMRGRAP